MIRVRVIVQDIEGLGISAAVDAAGTVWVVLSPKLQNPYLAFGEVMNDLIGCLPDECTYEFAPQLQLAS